MRHLSICLTLCSYHASGRIALAKHAEGPPSVERVRQYEEAQAKAPPKMTTRGERLGLIPRRAPLVPVVQSVA